MSALDLSAPSPLAVERISVREFARRAACDDKQVRRAIHLRRISVGSDGLVDAAQLDSGWRRPNRRARPDGRGYASPDANLSAQDGADNMNLSASAAPARVVRTTNLGEVADDLLAGRFASLPEALRIKENALALKHIVSALGEARKLFPGVPDAPGDGAATAASGMDWPARVAPAIAAELGIPHQADALRDALQRRFLHGLTTVVLAAGPEGRDQNSRAE